MALIHGSYSLWQLGGVAVWILGMKLAAMDLTEMDRALGDAVHSALVSIGMTVKEAAAVTGMDESQFRKALRGEGYRHLSLNHLVKLGPMFMVHLTSSLMWLTAKQRAQDILETVSVRKGA